MKPRCGDCRYGDRTGDAAVLVCRVMAPDVGGFPRVHPNDWCGQFQPKGSGPQVETR